MKKKILTSIIAILLAVCPPCMAESPSVLLEKGIYNEETKGDLNAAMKIYKQIVADNKTNQKYAAEAQYRLGMCLTKQNKDREAAEAFSQLINQFSNQREVVSKATIQLREIRKQSKIVAEIETIRKEAKKLQAQQEVMQNRVRVIQKQLKDIQAQIIEVDKRQDKNSKEKTEELKKAAKILRESLDIVKTEQLAIQKKANSLTRFLESSKNSEVISTPLAVPSANAEKSQAGHAVTDTVEGREIVNDKMPSIQLSHDDGKFIGMQSFGGTGVGIRFQVPADGYKLASVSFCGMRYGDYKVPKENFDVILCDSKYKVLKKFSFSYSTFAQRGETKWADLPVKPTAIPKNFVLFLNFHAHQTKGIYVYYSTLKGDDSLVGLPDQPVKNFTKGNWMIRTNVIPPKSSGKNKPAGAISK